jgi:hypothetical protein
MKKLEYHQAFEGSLLQTITHNTVWTIFVGNNCTTFLTAQDNSAALKGPSHQSIFVWKCYGSIGQTKVMCRFWLLQKNYSSFIFYGPLKVLCDPHKTLHSLGRLLVLTLAGWKIPLTSLLNSLTNQKMFFTSFFFLVGWMCCSSLFPMLRGEALSVIRRRLVSHLLLS